MAHLSYQPGRSRPDYCGIYHADVLTGVYAFGAISAALYQRHGSQKGQHIDVSMLESMLSLTLERIAVVAIRGEADPAADVRADRDRGWLCDGGHRQRENLPEPDQGHRSSRVDRRSALCEIFRPPRQLGRSDGRRRDVVAHAHDRKMPRRIERATAFPVRPIARSPKHCAIRKSPIAARCRRWRTAAARSRC